MSQIITIIGKTNVGKSTLFNCLTKNKDSITNNIPFFTRDRKYGILQLNNKNCTLIDTAALSTDFFSYKTNNLTYCINKQTKIAIQEAHIILFLITAYSHLDSFYKKIIKFLQKKNKTIIFIINKIDYMIPCSFNYLNYDDQTLFISALHKINIKHLLTRISGILSNDNKTNYINQTQNTTLKPFLLHNTHLKITTNIIKTNQHTQNKTLKIKNTHHKITNNNLLINSKHKNIIKSFKQITTIKQPINKNPIKLKAFKQITTNQNKHKQNNNHKTSNLTNICIIGKTNVGKSTLINSLVKETRLIINHQPGTTRENITIKILYKNHLFLLTDTKGITNTIKQLKLFSKFIHHYDIVFYVIDATRGFFEQDIFLLKQILFSGKHLFLIFNKCDAINNKQIMFIHQLLYSKLYQFTKILTMHFISALYLYNFVSIFNSLDLFVFLKTKFWSIKFLTNLLNLAIKKKPLFKNKHNFKLLLAKQININPIIIVVFGQTTKQSLPNHYKRYLFNFLVQKLNITNLFLQLHFF
ncbi:GTPase [Candidatus Portiera aleyrodidarum]|uniref:GTPase n=1 Tax=Candidatus Portiera aleyrodidarum TaxID=91844 RepID=UPI00027B3046|nr:GTPase [Candidatus Portiera aleyrodidarum]AFQ24016.1 small GTP-binding protein domain protein [Candidatus Portiera aleyrodidarum BT-B-HRs]ASX27179.1 GTP-binding protein [Candidatus Portiera aleyrodidarum MED (Bemisia tabaci)]